MAQGRPISRHGRVDAFKRMPVDGTDLNNMYQHQEYISARPKSGYKKRSEGVDYDSYARVPDSPRVPPPRPMSRRKMDGPTLNHSDSDDNYLPSSPDGPLVSPKSPIFDSRQHTINQNKRGNNSDAVRHSYSPTSSRPPTSGSARPPSASARRRSARLHHRDNNDLSQTFQNDSQDSLPSMAAIRPPSSFSKYRPLPAIGTPTPSERDGEQKFLFNDFSAEDRLSRNEFHSNNSQSHNRNINNQPNPSHDNYLGLSHGRISSAVSDISVLSTKANSSRRTSENSAASELIERLDLSQLEKQSENTRRRKPSSNQSPLNKPKSGVSSLSKFDTGEFYDGDDDDSDTNNIDCVNTFVQGKREGLHNPPSRPSTATKNPVIIPSQNQLADANNLEQEQVLLAIKLPTDGTRHQRYFQRSETLMSIVEFAEEQAGQDFAGYILISAATKNVYEELGLTIEESGLEDRSMLHLEEID